uniref:ATP-binding protein n=1 Tax=Lactiplantibacillus TaxID=2767842 RepID=UPI0034A01386
MPRFVFPQIIPEFLVFRQSLARFPYEKTLADFDFSYQPGINQGIIEDLGSLRFTQENQ